MAPFLTARDGEVIECLFRGLCMADIAKEMGIAKRTVKQHVAKIAQLMNIDSRQFVSRVRIVYLLAVQRGLITPFRD